MIILTLFLLSANFLLTLVTITTVAIYFLVMYLITAGKLESYGRSRFMNNQARYSKIDDFFNLFKLSYVMKRTSIYLERYSNSSLAMAKAQYAFDFVATAPRIILEGILFVIVLFIYWVQNSNSYVSFDVNVFDLSILIMG